MNTSTVYQPDLTSGEIPNKIQSRRSLQILKTISYVLAGLVLALGVAAGLSLLASASNVHNILLPLQLMGADVLANLITPYLSGLISGLGVVSMLVSLVLSLLLFAVGRLLAHIAGLETRLARLEVQRLLS